MSLGCRSMLRLGKSKMCKLITGALGGDSWGGGWGGGDVGGDGGGDREGGAVGVRSVPGLLR